jgi:hypothetical protein
MRERRESNGNPKCESSWQTLKEHVDRVSTPHGIRIDFRDKHDSKARFPIIESQELLSKATKQSLRQREKQREPIETTEEGIQIDQSGKLPVQDWPGVDVSEETSNNKPEKQRKRRGRARLPV